MILSMKRKKLNLECCCTEITFLLFSLFFIPIIQRWMLLCTIVHIYFLKAIIWTVGWSGLKKLLNTCHVVPNCYSTPIFTVSLKNKKKSFLLAPRGLIEKSFFSFYNRRRERKKIFYIHGPSQKPYFLFGGLQKW